MKHHTWTDEYGVKWQIRENWTLWKKAPGWDSYFNFTLTGVAEYLIKKELTRIAKEIETRGVTSESI